MERNDRIAMYEGVLDIFLTRAKEKGWITFETPDDRDQFVQYMRHSGRVYCEVGSRQWTDPERPLPPAAVASLAQLGFTGGGPERNFAKDDLPASKMELAVLTDALFKAAYDVDDGFSPVVHALNLNDVTLPRAQPFTRDLIEAHLNTVGVQFLRDKDGDFRVDLNCEGLDQPLMLWFIADGTGDAIYHITSSTATPVPLATRELAVERCNTWNREHRWPKALVLDADDAIRIATSADLDLSEGVTPALLANFTDGVVHGAIEFWSWVVPNPDEAPADASRDSRDER